MAWSVQVWWGFRGSFVMIFKNVSALMILLCLAPTVMGATWEVTVDAPETGTVLSVALGEEVQSLESVRVRLVGYNKVGGYSCDGVSFPEYLYLEGTFGDPSASDDMQLMDEIMNDDIIGSEFDIMHEFDLTDSAAWAFLDDGTAGFTISWWRVYPDPLGYCMHLFSEFHLYSITLSIDYNGAVPVDGRSWGTLKALYCD